MNAKLINRGRKLENDELMKVSGGVSPEILDISIRPGDQQSTQDIAKRVTEIMNDSPKISFKPEKDPEPVIKADPSFFNNIN